MVGLLGGGGKMIVLVVGISGGGWGPVLNLQ